MSTKTYITQEQIIQIAPYSKGRIDRYMPFINPALEQFGITQPSEIAAWIAQVAHESGQFRYVRELASGVKYDTGQKAKDLGNTPEADGDGQRTKGRGLIQITGTRNYRLVGMVLDEDFLQYPERLEEPKNAVYSAAWYWYNNNLNRYCHPCTRENFVRITRRINGGTNGLQDRLELWERAKKVLDTE